MHNCTCCKILETLIASNLTEFLLEHNLISKTQHGFLKKHSTCTNLLESLNDWTLLISNRKSVVVGYVDFQRAFDSISYPKLILKLQSYGIAGNLLFWIQAFLSNRIQSVRIGSVLSSSCHVTSGVPQGSVLGPLLFNLFINDISDPFLPQIITKLFADDIKLYTDLTILSAVHNFQSHLNHIQTWATTWQIGISYSKCNTVEFGPHPSHVDFFISNNKITKTTTTIDLGVRFESSLKFNSHINGIVNRAHQRANLIMRSFLSKNITNLIRAHKTYIRPLLEYASPVWSPSQITLINSIEAVQRRFTKRLPGMDRLSYAERLSLLKLQSLEQRRLCTDLITYYNIIHGHTSLNFADFFTYSHNPSSRGHPFRLTTPIAKNNTQQNFFSCRAVAAWNSLPSVAVSAPSIQSFKRQLHNLNLAKFISQPWIIS